MNWKFSKSGSGEERLSLYCGRYYARISPSNCYILKRYKLDFYKCIYKFEYDENIEAMKLYIQFLIEEDINKIMNQTKTIFFNSPGS